MKNDDLKRKIYSPANTCSFISIVACVCVCAYMVTSGRMSLPTIDRIMSDMVNISAPLVVGDEWQLVLVNSNNPLPTDFTVDLRTSPMGYSVDMRIVPELDKMLAAAKKDGVSLQVLSGYRSISTSDRLYNSKVREFIGKGYAPAEAAVMAAKWVAPPSTSEHHTGLALDIISTDYYSQYEDLYTVFETFPAAVWLQKHAPEYGFILRYPKDKTEVTGIAYEPWHYRYVGKENARYITEHNLTLEEYLG